MIGTYWPRSEIFSWEPALWPLNSQDGVSKKNIEILTHKQRPLKHKHENIPTFLARNRLHELTGEGDEVPKNPLQFSAINSDFWA